jgi:hypothetical protein
VHHFILSAEVADLKQTRDRLEHTVADQSKQLAERANTILQLHDQVRVLSVGGNLRKALMIINCHHQQEFC